MLIDRAEAGGQCIVLLLLRNGSSAVWCFS
jgi:hypothetical protein